MFNEREWLKREKGMIEFIGLETYNHSRRLPAARGGNEQFNNSFHLFNQKQKIKLLFLIKSMKWIYELNWLIKNNIITVFIGSNPLSPSIKILMELMIVKEINGIIILFALG